MSASCIRRGIVLATLQESGLPLEQTFAATLHESILDHQHCFGSQAGRLDSGRFASV